MRLVPSSLCPRSRSYRRRNEFGRSRSTTFSCRSQEMARVRQAIRDGTLWELAEQRATAHPALRAGLAGLKASSEVFVPTEPESRRAFRETGPTSYDRPVVRRWRHRSAAYRENRPLSLALPRFPLVPAFLERIPLADPSRCGPPLGVPDAIRARAPRTHRPLPGRTGATEAEFIGDGTTARAPSPRFERGRRCSGPSDGPFGTGRRSLDPAPGLAALEWRYGSSVSEGCRRRPAGRTLPTDGSSTRAMVAGRPAVRRRNRRDSPADVPRGDSPNLHSLLGPPGATWSHADAVPFVREGRTLFSAFVVQADPALVPGSSALLVDENDSFLAVGRLLLAPHEMARLPRGVAVRVTAPTPVPPADGRVTSDGSGTRGASSARLDLRPRAIG